MENFVFHPEHRDLISDSQSRPALWSFGHHLVVETDERFIGVDYGAIRPVDVAMSQMTTFTTTLAPSISMKSAGTLNLSSLRSLLKRVRRACGNAQSSHLRAYEIGSDYVISTNSYVLSYTGSLDTGLTSALVVPVAMIDDMVSRDVDQVEVSYGGDWVVYTCDNIVRGFRVPSHRGLLKPFVDSWNNDTDVVDKGEFNRVELSKRLRAIEPDADNTRRVTDADVIERRSVDAELMVGALACLSTKMVSVRANPNRVYVSNSVTTACVATLRFQG